MMTKTCSIDKKGSAILAALITTILAGVVVAGLLSVSLMEVKMSKRHLESQQAIVLAEAGLEEGVRAMLAGDWSGWTSYGSFGYYKAMDGSGDGVHTSDARTGGVKIYVHSDPTDPAIAAEATLTSDAAGSSIVRQVRVDMLSGSLFDNGVVSRRSTTFKGGGVLVDSYDSRLGAYSTSNRSAEGTVATLAILNDAVSVGNGHVRGYVATGGGTPDFGPNGTVHDYSGSYPAKYKDPARITTDFYASLPTITPPDVTAFIPLGSVGSSTTLSSSWPDNYIASSISLGGTKKLTIADDTTLVVMGDISISGNAMIDIAPTAEVKIYVYGSMSISGNGLANGSEEAKNLIIYGMNSTDGAKKMTLGGNAKLYAAVYAPSYEFDINGGGSSGDMMGAVVGYSVTFNGGANFHYDVALADLSDASNYTIESWRELRTTAEQLPFSTPAKLQDSF